MAGLTTKRRPKPPPWTDEEVHWMRIGIEHRMLQSALEDCVGAMQHARNEPWDDTGDDYDEAIDQAMQVLHQIQGREKKEDLVAESGGSSGRTNH